MLETPRLRLRRLTQLDVDDYSALIRDPEVMRFIGGTRGDPHDAAKAIEQLNARHETDGFGVLAVERLSDSRFIGRVGFWVWDRRDWAGGRTRREIGVDAEIELGWALLRTAWGHGYATEAASLMRAYGFREIGLTRLISLIHPENERSLRVAERLGALHECDIETARWGPARLYVHSNSRDETLDRRCR